MTINTSSAFEVLDKTSLYATAGWVIPAAEAVKKTIEAETRIGRDSDDEPFEDWEEGHVYSPSQEKKRKRAMVTVDVKNLNVTGALLGGLKLREKDGIPILSVAEKSSDKLNRIAHGLMYNLKWRYHMKFLDAGKAAYTAVMLAVKGAF